MYVIAGLGNPGAQYQGTRHNAGFSVIDCLAKRYQIDVSTRKHRALIGKGMVESERALLVKPQTFMNLSGESIREVLEYYKLTPSELIVIYDDISLTPGQLRIRGKGSAGGHNGVKNIIAQLGTQEFWRIKVGVGEKPPRMDLVDHVLGHFPKEEQPVMEEAFLRAAQAVPVLLEEGLEAAMNRFNSAANRP